LYENVFFYSAILRMYIQFPHRLPASRQLIKHKTLLLLAHVLVVGNITEDTPIVAMPEPGDPFRLFLAGLGVLIAVVRMFCGSSL
jgi:hypothetical protein